MMDNAPEWLAPTSLDEALQLRAELNDEATVIAGGTFVGILMNQGFLAPTTLLSLKNVPDLDVIEVDGDLRLGAMVTHRAVERSPDIRKFWPALSYAFSLVASPRVRNQATVGGVLADADYASDPPAILAALDAYVVLRGPGGERKVPVHDFIQSYYQTAMEANELLTEVRVPRGVTRAVYRKFRSRSSEDRPCVAVAAAQSGDTVRVVVGAVTERPQYFPDICALATGSAGDSGLNREIAEAYARRIDPISDSRGSAAYRRRVIGVEVRRALEDLSHA